MKRGAWTLCLIVVTVCSGRAVWAEVVPFTLEDRDRLIRTETTLQEFKDSVDRRFEAIEQRFEAIEQRFEAIEQRFDDSEKRSDGRLQDFQASVTGRLADLNRFLTILAGIFISLVIAVISLVIWDRRTALAPAMRRSQELELREDRIERALRTLAQKDQAMADALRQVGLL